MPFFNPWVVGSIPTGRTISPCKHSVYRGSFFEQVGFQVHKSTLCPSGPLFSLREANVTRSLLQVVGHGFVGVGDHLPPLASGVEIALKLG